ncbi:MAG: NAD-dependent epimerase/dehydratase family protein [Acidobacteriota bacterium]
MKVIITGGAGFIGSNAANRFLSRGDEVVIIDNLSRHGSEQNLKWLGNVGLLEYLPIDICDGRNVARAFAMHRDADLVLHLAGQVAVTTSVADPRSDFEANALGTFNVLEGIRLAGIHAPVIYASTNKVYGEMENTQIVIRNGRYDYANLPNGVKEDQCLDFHSPYGCSKGAGDQYVHDYYRIYGLNTVVFRQSCIYGYRQFGYEDQGWVAWFTIASQLGQPITVYGDGKQVRDILFVEDLIDAYEAAAAHIDHAAGRIYNIGGGPENVISLHDLLAHLERHEGQPIPYLHGDWRPGDQRIYVSDINRARRELHWTPKVDSSQGLNLLYAWVSANLGLFAASQKRRAEAVLHSIPSLVVGPLPVTLA